MLEKFKMNDAKPIGTLLAGHFKLGLKQCPSNKKEKDEMKVFLIHPPLEA